MKGLMNYILRALPALMLLCLLSSCESMGTPHGTHKPNALSEIEQEQDDPEGVNDDELGDETVPTEIQRKF